MHGNIDARTHLIHRYPYLKMTLDERSFSTDDLETEFGMLVMLCGYKPCWTVASGALHAIDELTAMKRDPHLGFSLPTSTAAKYSHQRATAKKDERWHIPDPDAIAKYLAHVTYKAKRQARDKRTVRDFHSTKG
ncbi:hypothetical protein CYMTET_26810 [Cymbomonas tetramitiformis]|uniref:Uncharacterized protein n=1 Tax=Cymbomonas tetramitiformis TaxID=36881 RepID=A0AAE0FSJ3_9CHLO|nr:hypothetical protein CYMTET_26810 [Cymbomonas tetramitiformis]